MNDMTKERPRGEKRHLNGVIFNCPLRCRTRRCVCRRTCTVDFLGESEGPFAGPGYSLMKKKGIYFILFFSKKNNNNNKKKTEGKKKVKQTNKNKQQKK